MPDSPASKAEPRSHGSLRLWVLAVGLAALAAAVAGVVIFQVSESPLVDHTTAAPLAPLQRQGTVTGIGAGHVRWRVSTASAQAASLLVAGWSLVLMGHDGVTVLDGRTGRERWHYRRRGAVVEAAAVTADDRFLVVRMRWYSDFAQQRWLSLTLGFSLDTGQLRWQHAGSQTSQSLIPFGDDMLMTCSFGGFREFGGPAPPDGARTWLRGHQWLYARRAPGSTCLHALAEARGGEARVSQYGGQATNDSKGCGAVMRSAPFGLLPSEPAWDAFGLAAEAAGYTHGHPTGRLAAGALAAIISRLVAGDAPPAAADAALGILAASGHHQETTAAVRRALAADVSRPSAETVETLGGGWTAEEALAIALYAALAFPLPGQFLDALSLAVTHSGDSDSTGAICGNILGALHGETALPPQLAFEVEGRGTILQLADDFVWEFTAPGQLHGDYGPHTRWTIRYGSG